MKFNIVINQKAIIDNGWKLKANHIAVLEVIKEFILCGSSETLINDDKMWHWVSYELILEQIPMFEISKDRCRQLIKELSNYELIEIYPENQILGKTYFKIGKNYNKFIFEESDKHDKKEAAPIEKIQEVQQKPLEKIQDPSEKNSRPPLEKIQDNNSHKDNSSSNSSIGEIGKNELDYIDDEYIQKIANECWEDKIWIENVIYSNKWDSSKLVLWMKAYNANLSSSDFVKSTFTKRNYKRMFNGWIQTQKSKGFDYGNKNNEVLQKGTINNPISAAPLTRV